MARVLAAVLVGLLLASCRTPIGVDEPPEVARRLGTTASFDVKEFAQGTPDDPPSAPEEDARVVHTAPPGALHLRVEGARELALVNNLGLKVQRYAPQIARETYDAERAKFDAVFRTSIRAARLEQIEGTPGTVTGSRGLVLEPGIELPLRSGGTISVGLPLTYDASDIQDFPDEEYSNAVLNLSYVQPLLRGAGSAVNTASIRVARLQNRQEEAKTKLYAIRVLANAERAYWDLYAAEREVTIRRKQLEAAEEQREQVKRMVEEGTSPRIEIDRAEAGVARRLEAILVAETIRRRVQRELKVILNLDDMPVDSESTIFVATDPTPLGLDLDRAALVHHAVRNRMEMLELELQVAIDEVTLQVDRNQTLPNLALEFDYSFRGRSSGSVFTALDRIQTDQVGDLRMALNFSQPIGRRAARARLRRSLLSRGRTLADKRRQEQEIGREVLDAVDQLEQDWQRVLAAGKDIKFSIRTWKGEQHQFALGMRTTTEVLEALDFVADAQSREVRALAAFQRSLVELAFATGTVLGMSKVSW